MARTVLEVVMAADPRSLERGFARGAKASDQFGRTVDKNAKASSAGLRSIGTAAKVAGGAFAASALVGQIKGFAKAAAESEASTARLKTQLAASGVSYKRYAANIDTVIQKTSRLAAVDDEDLQDAFTNIVRSTGNVTQSMKLVGLATDIARAKNIDVAKAGQLVGKVATGNTGVLARYGIQIDKNATSSEALASLQGRFAGQAEAYGRTSAGAFARFQVASDNLKETIGGALAPTIATVANNLSTLITQMQTGTGFGGRIREVFDRVATAAKGVAQKVGDVARFFRENKTAGTALVATMAGLVTGFAAFRILTGVTSAITALKNAQLLLNLAMKANPLARVIAVVVGLGTALVVAYKKSETFRRIVDGVFSALKTAAGTAIAFVLRRISDLLGGFSSFASAAAKVPIIGDKFKGVADKIDGARRKLDATADSAERLAGKKVDVKVRLTYEEIIAGQRRQGAPAGPAGPNGSGDGIGRTVRGIAAATGARRAPAKLASALPTAGAPSSALRNANSALAPFARIGAAAGLSVTSGKRNKGDGSYHNTGEAIDLSNGSGPTPEMLAVFRTLKSRYGSRLAELIYSPGGLGIKDGKPYNYGPKINAAHRNHVHVAMDLGSPGPGIGNGRTFGDGPGRYNAAAYKSLWQQAGGPASSAVIAAAVGLAEGAGNPRAFNRNSNGTVDRGLWQINSIHKDSTFDPLGNAKAAVRISNRGRNWRPWVAYTNGSYRKFLGAAQAAKGGAAGRAGATSKRVPKGKRVDLSKGFGAGGSGPPVLSDADQARADAALAASAFNATNGGGGSGSAGGDFATDEGIDPGTQALIDAQNAATAAAEAAAEQARQDAADLAAKLQALYDVAREQANIANTTSNIENAQLVKALADILSGQIVGVDLQGRTQTAGSGSVVRY